MTEKEMIKGGYHLNINERFVRCDKCKLMIDRFFTPATSPDVPGKLKGEIWYHLECAPDATPLTEVCEYCKQPCTINTGTMWVEDRLKHRVHFHSYCETLILQDWIADNRRRESFIDQMAEKLERTTENNAKKENEHPGE